MNRRHLTGFLLGCMLSGIATAAAPVVDNSERFAANEASDPWNDTTHTDTRPASSPSFEEAPLAHEDASRSETHSLNRINRFNALQQEIQELRGQLEVQAHELKQLKEQQLTFYKDLDSRLQASKAEPLAPPVTHPPAQTLQNQVSSPLIEAQTVAPPPATHTNPADEQLSYMEAYERVKNREYDEALVAMQAFVQQYPHGGYTANAHYWLGELYLVKKNYTQAIAHFEKVLTQFPGSSKIAASTLKIGYALAASGKPAEARQQLQQVIKNYPDTPTAQLATAKLRSLHYT